MAKVAKRPDGPRPLPAYALERLAGFQARAQQLQAEQNQFLADFKAFAFPGAGADSHLFVDLDARTFELLSTAERDLKVRLLNEQAQAGG